MLRLELYLFLSLGWGKPEQDLSGQTRWYHGRGPPSLLAEAGENGLLDEDSLAVQKDGILMGIAPVIDKL
ncbi:hypothetical protein BR63_01530 [Thermanaerosceptrum fracticalcis]|uniref:Uncharacterized protein n=1 Tax=Thermanaerosceptrum fracticalcis TaxID=1712410 RepID=A0A7G6DZ61_THEFR|nr:hypothetical protein [Thermanaerosceptrum fracticalcis]QNB45115.1 hypothetical protein BR63_01530 [Thermanaerosceptrum fracticalcis]